MGLCPFLSQVCESRQFTTLLVAGSIALVPLASTAQEFPLEAPPRSDYVDLGAEIPIQDRPFSYAMGVATSSSPEYSGSDKRKYSLKPILALRYGRYKLSSSGGSAILNFGSQAQSSGASADLIDTQSLKLKVSARIGGGRSTSDSSDLAGLPDISKTVFTRLSASYQLSERLSMNTTVSWDLLGRGNGVTVSAGLGYKRRFGQRSEWTVGTGITYANSTHMHGLFGVPANAALPDRPAYQAQAGLKDVGLGAGFTTALSKRWIVFGNTGYTYLLGSAADSPLTRGRGAVSASIGIGYRCCK